MINIKNCVFLFFVFCVIQSNDCESQIVLRNNERGKSVYDKYNARFTDANIMLGCLVFSNQLNKKDALSSREKFVNIATDYQKLLAINKPKDSLIEEIVEQNRHVFDRIKIIDSLHNFIEVYDIVTNQIFSRISSDEDVEAMKILEGKILKFSELASIYRLYLKPGLDLSSLTSIEGIALDIHISVYLSKQNIEVKLKIIKGLL